MPDPSTLLGQLLAQAEALPDQLRRLAPDAPQLPKGASVPPLHMVAALRPWFDAQYLAGLTLLRDPKVAPAADIVLRGLTELFAAVGWVFEGGPASERECRAICYTRGVVRSTQNALKSRSEQDPETVARLKELADLEGQIRRQWKEEGCKCPPWSY